jgi:pimeloyl-CoA synthetase
MQDTIRAVIENTIAKSRLEVGFNMNTNIVETLPWIDYREVFQKIEERSKTAAQTEIALNAFRHAKPGGARVIETLKDFGISDDAIKNAYKQVETERAEKSHDKKRSEPER